MRDSTAAMETEMPPPLVPAGVHLRDFAFMPLDVNRLMASDTWILGSAEERVACIALWCAAWHQQPAGSLPSNERALAHLSQANANWAAVREHALRGWVKCSDGRLYHPIICSKALEAWLEKLAQRKKSRKGNEARWGAEFDEDAIDADIDAARTALVALDPNSRQLRKASTAKRRVVDVPAGSAPAIPEGNSEGNPQGNPAANPRENPSGIAQGIPNASLSDPKRQGQGQGIEKKKSKDPSPNGDVSSASAADASESRNGEPGTAGSDQGMAPCPHEAIVAAFHATLPQCPQVRTWHDSRRKHLRARWREDPERQSVDWWRGLFEYIATCPFLVGKSESRGRTPFFVTLPWLVERENFSKVLEGNYEAAGADA